MGRHIRRIDGKTLRTLRAEATERPRCKHDGYLLDKTGECWFCRRVNRAARHAYKVRGCCF